jgi:membrane-associated phospholipid phosphatase
MGTRVISLVAGLALIAGKATAQEAQKTLFVSSDVLLLGATVAGSALVSLFDVRIANWSQQPGVQGSSTRHSVVDAATVVNEMPLTAAALLTYGVGRLSGSSMLADVGLHTTEALVITVATAELARTVIGRSRPRSSPADEYNFVFGRGFTNFDNRAYPSLHAAVGFAAASALIGEVRERNPSAVPYVAPVLYAAAMIPGLTRIYLNQHWASDVVAGSVLGAFIGSRIVSYAHSHERTKFDRIMLGVNVTPEGDFGLSVSFALP